jgi:hypothetical protein
VTERTAPEIGLEVEDRSPKWFWPGARLVPVVIGTTVSPSRTAMVRQCCELLGANQEKFRIRAVSNCQIAPKFAGVCPSRPGARADQQPRPRDACEVTVGSVTTSESPGL